jgi:hypothetical protein
MGSLDVPGEGTHSGFDNLGTGFKYQFVRDADRELAIHGAVDVALASLYVILGHHLLRRFHFLQGCRSCLTLL